MFFNVALFTSLLLAPEALAIPSGLGARIARRREGRQSQLNDRFEQDTSVVSNTDYSYNWAGAVWNKNADTFTSVTGTFTVPAPSGSPGASAAAWVGIDGDTCQSAILQTGVDFTVSDDGGATYDAWYEWLPANAYDFSGITISAGDVIKLTVTAYSPTSGIAIIENLSKNERVSQTLTSTSSLCEQDAEWIVEDYLVNGVPVELANFGTVTFTNTEATGSGTYTTSGATVIEMVNNNGQPETSVSIDGSTLIVKYE